MGLTFGIIMVVLGLLIIVSMIIAAIGSGGEDTSSLNGGCGCGCVMLFVGIFVLVCLYIASKY